MKYFEQNVASTEHNIEWYERKIPQLQDRGDPESNRDVQPNETLQFCDAGGIVGTCTDSARNAMEGTDLSRAMHCSTLDTPEKKPTAHDSEMT